MNIIKYSLSLYIVVSVVTISMSYMIFYTFKLVKTYLNIVLYNGQK